MKLSFKQYLQLVEADSIDSDLANIKNQQAIVQQQKARDTKKYDDKNALLQKQVVSLTQKQAQEQKKADTAAAAQNKTNEPGQGAPTPTGQVGFQGNVAPGKATFP